MNNTNNEKTRLEKKFAFWYRIFDDSLLGTKQINKNEYENQVKKIAEFDNIEDFWGIFQHLRKPDSSKPGVEFQMFKDGIKPMWEDEGNKSGGKLSFKLKKDFTTIIWEEMIMSIIGGIYPQNLKEEINGIVVSIRKEYNIIQIWVRDFSNPSILQELEQTLRELIQIPENVEIETKPFFRRYSNTKFSNPTNTSQPVSKGTSLRSKYK